MVSTTKEELLYLADQQAYARSRYHEDDADLIRESLVIEQALRLSAQQREPVVRVPKFSVIMHQIALWSDDEGLDLSTGQGDALTRRIRSAIEIAPQSDRQPLPDQKQISETGKELPENEEQPMNNADVSVGELAGFFVTEFPHLLTMLTQIEVARALLARFRIERLDRLAKSWRR